MKKTAIDWQKGTTKIWAYKKTVAIKQANAATSILYPIDHQSAAAINITQLYPPAAAI